MIVMDDADLDKAAEAIAVTGFAQRRPGLHLRPADSRRSKKSSDHLLDALKPRVEATHGGDRSAEGTKMGPMVREADAVRVETWIKEAVAGGARLVTGRPPQSAMHEPTILGRVRSRMRVSCDELFGPAVAVTRFDDIDEAIRLANDTRYGLSAAIFTQDLDRAMKFAREVDSGNLHVNWSDQWRADLMPYGGLKDSGLGKEGPKYAIREMTEEKMVVLHVHAAALHADKTVFDHIDPPDAVAAADLDSARHDRRRPQLAAIDRHGHSRLEADRHRFGLVGRLLR